MDKSHRDTILVETAEILLHDSYPGQQYVIRVAAPGIAARARPGSFAHIQCAADLPMRRPLSIMRADPDAGWVEFLYKTVGTGTVALTQRKPGESISVMGPIGTEFTLDDNRPRALLMGGGVGIPPMIFMADILRAHPQWQPLVLMGSEVPFPFKAQPSRFIVPGLDDGVIAAMPLLEDWEIPSRLASLQGYAGCHEGYITDLARQWLTSIGGKACEDVTIYACGPHPMLAATARLADEFALPCQVAMEEFMACGVGGCAGCTVKINGENGPMMKRVCVDGPVFDARQVDWG